MLKYYFSYTDEFGNKTILEKELTEARTALQTDLELLVEQFQNFLMAAGFPSEIVKKINITEGDD